MRRGPRRPAWRSACGSSRRDGVPPRSIANHKSQITSVMPSLYLKTWSHNQIAVTAAAFVGFIGFTLVMPFLPLYIRELGVTDDGDIALWAGLAMGVTPAVAALCGPLWGRVADRFGNKILVQRSLLSFVLVMIAMAYVTEAWHLFALRALQGFVGGYGALTISMAALSAPRERMAQAIGAVQTAQRLGPAIGPVFGGLLAPLVGLAQRVLRVGRGLRRRFRAADRAVYRTAAPLGRCEPGQWTRDVRQHPRPRELPPSDGGDLRIPGRRSPLRSDPAAAPRPAWILAERGHDPRRSAVLRAGAGWRLRESGGGTAADAPDAARDHCGRGSRRRGRAGRLRRVEQPAGPWRSRSGSSASAAASG